MLKNEHISIITNKGLSLFFATCCIIDLFGVFPIVALPRAIIECGWLGLPLTFIVFCVQIHTALMLGRCWIIAEKLQGDIHEKSRYPYSAMIELAYGKGASIYVNVILYLAVFGGSVPNLIVASQGLELVGLKLSSYRMDFSYCYWIIIIGIVLCPIMWLGSPKDMKWIAVSSVIFVLSSSFLTWFCLIKGRAPQDPIIPSPSWESTAIAYGILSFQFDVHPMILTVQMDMKNKHQLGRAIFLAFFTTGSLFFITTLICYNRFGIDIHYNTLQGLEPSYYLYADFTIVIIQIGLSMIVGATPLFQDLEDKLNIPVGFGWKRCVLRTGVVMGAVFLGEVVPRFDLIMGLIGGGLMGQLMFIFPPLLYARLRSMQAQKEARKSGRIRQMTYGTLGNIFKPHQALIIGTHRRADLTWEDYLDRPHLFRSNRRDDANLLSMGKVEDGPLSVWEKLSNIIVIIFGAAAAILSTYYSLKGTIKYADFTPPCISNVTLASRLIYKFT